jgi:glucokinase
MAKKVVVGIDLGGTKVMVAVLDEKLKVLTRVKMRTHGEEGPKATVLRMAKLVRKGLDEIPGGVAAKISYVGVGAPGPLKPGTGVIVAAPNLGWKNVPLKKMLEAQLKCPVNVDNDVNMGTYGEYFAGAAKGKSLVVGLFPGTGIGGGIVIDGKVIQGASGSAGELGHIIVDPNGLLCGCGRRGCIETVASRLAIAKEVAVAAIRGQSPFMLKKYETKIEDMKSSAFAEAIDAGDKVVESIVRHAAHMLGIAAASVVNILSPDCIVLGGGLVEAMPKLFLEEVRCGIEEYGMPPIIPYVKVVKAALGDDAVAVGAAAYAREVLKRK